MSNDFWNGSTSTSDLDVSAFLDSGVTEQIAAVVDLGVLVSLGLTRDRGAIGIAVFDDGRRRREYFRTPEDASDWLRVAAKALSDTGLGRPAGQPRSSQTPTRGAGERF